MASPPAHHSAAFNAGVTSAVVRPQFDVFDDVVRLAEASGVLAVSVPHAAEVVAVAGHTQRRAEACSRDVVRGAFARVDSAWRDVASRLGVDPVPHDPAEAAHSIVSRAAARQAVVIVPMLGTSAWDEALCEAIAADHGQALFVLVVPRQVSLRAAGWSWFELDSRLEQAGLLRFWDAVAQQQLVRGSDLAELEAWLEEANRLELSAEGEAELSPDAARLLERLRKAARAWPVRQLKALGSASALDELERAKAIELRDGLVVARGEQAAELAGDDCAHIAAALGQCFPRDAWAQARAAELLAAIGEAEAAEDHMRSSLALAADASSRATLWRRWADLVESRPEGERIEARTRGAELALSLGDVEVALAWAQRASAGDGSARAAFVLGRAALARGDLVSADAALRRARELGQGTPVALQALIELAEVQYASGELDQAEKLSQQVLEEAELASVRLGARNVLGKLLLARARWSEADTHFATDACDAAFAGELVSELRARVNRAIALLSRGSPDEARPMLEKVLADAEERGELRAVGFALSNLAVLAIERHEYAHALDLSERAIVVRRQLGDRLGFARDVTNLVELRLRLGLVDQAEQALRFGRQALGPGAPASRLAELALAAARVHLARGRTLEAEREVRAALRTARHASDGDKLGECHRLAARISLEDGVIARAEEEVGRARELMAAPFAKAEVALLEGLVARAVGRPSAKLALSAVMQARESGDDELAREAHILAAETALADGDDDSAAEHIASAAALRDEVAAGLGQERRDAYLARRDMLKLARLERLIEVDDDEPEPESVRPSVRMKPAADVASSFVGRHPSVRALLTSVGRVGPTGATVLVRGESGSGKELIAEGIHTASDRRDGPLVKVNCAALVESLLLSELFGHEKGAFTGAASRKRGRFERASSGTLFLDEIGDISERTQVALLRVLEERTIERVGGSSPIAVDVRIVCATNRDLAKMVERGEFREDLYYRLSGITLEVPALRERLSDLPLLCDAMLGRIARERGEPRKTVSSEALELLARHRWPGNVRELENALRVACLFADTKEIQPGDFIEHVEVLRKVAAEPAPQSTVTGRDAPRRPSVPPPASVGLDSIPPPPDVPVTGVAYREIKDHGMSLSELKRHIERECIARALTETDGNITRAAAVLGMKRPRLSQLVKQYNLLSNDGNEDAS